MTDSSSITNPIKKSNKRKNRVMGKGDEMCEPILKCCQNSILPTFISCVSIGAYISGAIFFVPTAFPIDSNSSNTTFFLHIFNQLFGLIEITLLLTNYFKCMKTPPGEVEPNWQENFNEEELKLILKLDPQKNGDPKYCAKTGLTIPPRAHFSSVQKKLILRMDHYCVWVNNVVGLRNHKFFYLFLFYLVIAMGHFFILSILTGIQMSRDIQQLNVITFLLLIIFNVFLLPMSCMVTMFFGWNTYLICSNQTSIENYQLSDKRNRAKLKKLNKEHLKYLNFYQLSIFENMKQFLGQTLWKWPFPIEDNFGTDGYKYKTILPYENIIEMQKETFSHILPEERKEENKHRHGSHYHRSRKGFESDEESDEDDYSSSDELV
ncbi:hypothetical protein ABK040_014713 [Willaertia magna]